ncbi:MAG: phosphoribosylglycinamide formyltransferase 1 [Blastocatellia bacterium]|jgi:phosphoribosylglycinamide formyltransferase-1|nr:phosphoribosylglycinamide formyltransferase 1 [Blastocatellia bacterium]
MKLVIVASTGGSVMNQLLGNAYFKSRVHSVVSDRECGAVKSAAAHGVPANIFPEKDKEKFSAHVLEYLKAEKIDYAISFYTRLFAGELLHEYRDRIVNLHPSLLPAFKGLHGFDDAIAYGVRWVGSTIHFIDENMDEGKIIQQTIAPVDATQPIAFTRHRIFEQQCRSLLQVVKWLEDGRILVEGSHVRIKGATYDDDEFSPALDFVAARELKIPMPVEPPGDLGR